MYTHFLRTFIASKIFSEKIIKSMHYFTSWNSNIAGGWTNIIKFVQEKNFFDIFIRYIFNDTLNDSQNYFITFIVFILLIW